VTTGMTMDKAEGGHRFGGVPLALSVLLTLAAVSVVAHEWLSRPAAVSLASPRLGVEQKPGAAVAAPVNVGFAQDMSLHHEQALIMARLALANGTPSVHALAESIVNQQLKEIGYMQGWLLLWEASPTGDADDMPWMKKAYTDARRHDPGYEQFIASCATGQGMPGMATPQELEQLSTQRGAAFDRAFLAMMVRHHQGAVVMSRFASEYAETEIVRGFARSIASEQRREMIQMMTMLTAMQRLAPM
jgi:uncharacterized protein (DUF305 family)